MRNTFLQRAGTFFNLVGLTLLLLFIASLLGKNANGVLLFLSFTAFGVGFVFRRNKPVKESGRFVLVRRMNERSNQRRGARMNTRRNRGSIPGRRRPVSKSESEDEEENNEN
jgi:hypothetical protein